MTQLTQKFQTLEHRASEAKERISNVLSLQHHADERPWTLLGVSVAVGAAIGWLTGKVSGGKPRGGKPPGEASE